MALLILMIPTLNNTNSSKIAYVNTENRCCNSQDSIAVEVENESSHNYLFHIYNWLIPRPNFRHQVKASLLNQKQKPITGGTQTSEELITLIESSLAKDALPYEDELDKLEKNTDKLAQHYFEIGNHFYFKQQYDRSVSYLNKSAKLADPENMDFLIQIHLTQGNACLLNWKNPQALDCYQKLLEAAVSEKDLNHQIIAKSNIAIVLRRMNQLDEALVYCHELLYMIEKSSLKNAWDHVNILTIISEVYLDLEWYDSVTYHAQSGIAISKELNYPIGLVDLYTKQGIVYYYQKKLNKAFEQLTNAEKIIASENMSDRSPQVINLNYFLASYYFDNKSYNKSIDYLNKIIAQIEGGGLRKNRIADTYFLLAKCHYELGNAAQSIVAFSNYDTLRKEYEKDKDITVDKIHDTGTQNLREKIKVLESERVGAARNEQFTSIALLSTSLLAIILSVLYYFREHSNKKKFNELIQQISELESTKREEEVAMQTKEEVKPIEINDEKVNKVLLKLDKLESQEYFLRVDCSLREMAKKVKTNTTYLSKIINTHKGKNFNDYIRDLRIEYVLKRLKNDKKFRSYSIKFIALDIGYKSDNSFTKHFRAKTKLNPSYYIKNIDKLEQE